MDYKKAMKVWENEFGNKESAEDACGIIIKKIKYAEATSDGWEVDHIHPVSKGGSDSYDNLQPLNWKSNRKKEDKTGLKRGQCPYWIR